MCLAVPGRVLTITGADPLLRSARVDFDGAIKDISLALLPEAAVDDHVLVHAGFAIALVDEVEAARTREALDSLEIPAPGEVG